MVASIPAVYRARDSDAWRDCEIIGRHPLGLVLREIDKLWPGVWLTTLDQVRVPVGVIEQPEIVPRYYLPKNANRWKYRTIREACGRETALQTVLEP